MKSQQATYEDKITELFEEESALNADAAIFMKRLLQGHVQLDGVRENPLI
jgi:hypothetical protein